METSLATHGKEYLLDKFSLEKSLNKHCQPKKETKKPGVVEESNYHIIYSKCPVFIKNYKACKETRKSGSHMEKNKLIEIAPKEVQTLDLLDKGYK